MLNWFICLIRRHQWETTYDKRFKRNRTVCRRCGAEKEKLFDTDMNPSLFG